MSRKSNFVHSFLALGILVSAVSRVAAAPVTYSSLSSEQNNDPNDPGLTNYSTEVADHMADVSAAAPVVSSFLRTLTYYETETYDGYSPAPQPSLAFGTSNPSFATDTFTAVETVPPNSYAYSGNALLEYPGESGNSFTFSSPVTAFGTYIDQAGDDSAGDTLSLLLQNTNNSFSEVVPIGAVGPYADEFNIFYFGVTDFANPFNEVTLELTNLGDGVLLDNTTVGVPEPGSMALLGCGLLIGLAAFFVRRAWTRRRMAILLACGSC